MVGGRGAPILAGDQLVITAADFADSDEWARDGSPTPAHWLAAIADVETCTDREWLPS